MAQQLYSRAGHRARKEPLPANVKTIRWVIAAVFVLFLVVLGNQATHDQKQLDVDQKILVECLHKNPAPVCNQLVRERKNK